MVLLEVCVDSLEGAVTACTEGADRIELCSSLAEGGLTPSYGLIKSVRKAVTCRLYVMLRPRGGDFFYSHSELQVMKADMEAAADAGVDGIVVGMLSSNGSVDLCKLIPFVDFCQLKNLDLTFHRAFDEARDQREALEDLIACEVPRVLTSGGQETATMGAEKIRELVRQAEGHIIVMAAGGIRPHNVSHVCRLTGVSEIHSSCSRKTRSSMQWQPPLTISSSANPPPDGWRTVTDAAMVSSLRSKLPMHV